MKEAIKLKLFLDDERKPPKGWTLVKDYKSLYRAINENDKIDLISFDHDLGENTLDGYSIIKDMVYNHPDYFNKITEIQFHTSNIVGGKNMYNFLINYKENNKINTKIKKVVIYYIDEKLQLTPFMWE